MNEQLEKSWEIVLEKFPFDGYINIARKSGYFDMVKKVAKWSGTDVDVLDFGAGPCDKTALFSLVGMNVTAFDTLEDTWHKADNNREKILQFAEDVGINYLMPGADEPLPFTNKKFDVIMSHDVLEHFHSSPRIILNKLIECLKPGGILAITVPNAANLRKRLHLLIGKTNYNRYDYFYWYPGFWNGHVREYVKDDLLQMNEYIGMDLIDLSSYHLQLDVLPNFLRGPYKLFTLFLPGVRDSWMLVTKKPTDWVEHLEPSKEQIDKALGWHYFDQSKYSYDWKSDK